MYIGFLLRHNGVVLEALPEVVAAGTRLAVRSKPVYGHYAGLAQLAALDRDRDGRRVVLACA